MAETTLHLADIARRTHVLASGSDVLSGRHAGVLVRRASGLGGIGPSDHLVIVVHDRLIVAPAFFVGLLSGSFSDAANAAEAAPRIELRGASAFVRVNLEAALAVVAGPHLTMRSRALRSIA